MLMRRCNILRGGYRNKVAFTQASCTQRTRERKGKHGGRERANEEESSGKEKERDSEKDRRVGCVRETECE